MNFEVRDRLDNNFREQLLLFIMLLIALILRIAIIEGVIKSISHLKGYNTFNLGNNQLVKLRELISLIGKKMKKEYKINQIEMQPGDVDHTLADISHAQNVLGYQPTTPIDEGVEKFVTWYKEVNEK